MLKFHICIRGTDMYIVQLRDTLMIDNNTAGTTQTLNGHGRDTCTAAEI